MGNFNNWDWDSNWDWDYDHRDQTFLTNFDRIDAPIYKKAIARYIKNTKDDNFYIKDVAYDRNGNLLTNCLSLHIKINQNCSQFWDVFESIRKHYPRPWSFCFKKPINFKDWKTRYK